MTDISVIIPVYNCEKYIDICLDSILIQKFQDFEIICIDDGSVDNSHQILENYAKFDTRIKVFSTKHLGVSAARNLGITKACGNYITFIDSDDWIHPEMFSILYNKIKSEKCDWVACGLLQYDNKLQKYTNWKILKENEELNTCFSPENVSPDFMFKLHTCAVAKLYKTNFIKNNKFQDGKIFEDKPFFVKNFLLAKKIGIISTPMYYYRINRKNSILNRSQEKLLDIFDAFTDSENILLESNHFEKFKTHFLLYYMNFIFYILMNINETYEEKFFNKFVDFFKNINYEKYDLAKLKNNKYYKIINICCNMSYNEFLAKDLKREFGGDIES